MQMNRKLLLAVNLSAIAVIAAVTFGLYVMPKAQASAGSGNVSQAELTDSATETPTEPMIPVQESVTSATVPDSAVDSSWLSAVSARTGIPARALLAYTQATAQLNREQPGCGLAWNTLAALGMIESNHANGQLTANGDAAPKIIGPVLNGNGFAAIPDSDGGAFDGDARWDRAVGPLQFIPQTWQRYGRDGNGDGLADPQNIDDAALSAASYLCAAAAEAGSNGLRSAAGWSHAILAYNQSSAYLKDIFDAAQRYASQIQPNALTEPATR